MSEGQSGQSGSSEKETTLSPHDSELRNRRLFETAQDGILIIDFDSERIIDANPFLTKILGYPRDELAGKKLWEIGPFKDLTRSKIAFDELKTKGYIRYEDLPLQTRDGGRIDVEFVSNAYTIDGSKVIQCNIRDITERKQAEEALRASKDRYRMLFETMAQGAVYQDADGRIVSANPAAERILGLTLDQMQGRTSMDPRWKAIHEDGSDFPGETHPSMVALRTGKEVRNVVMGVFNPQTGNHHWININAVPQFKPGETKPFQAYTTFDDITERKKAEQALLVSEAKMRGVMDALPDFVFTLDANGVFIDYHASRTEELALPPEVFLGKNVREVLPQIAENSFSAMAAAKKTGLVQSFEYKLQTMTGQIGEYEARVAPTELGDFLVVVRNITDRKRMENELRIYSQHLEEMVFERTRKLAESERRFRELADLLPQIVFELDDKGKLTFLNHAGFASLGLAEADLQSVNSLHLFAPEDRDRATEGFRSRMRGEKSPSNEFTAIRRDGTTFPIALHVNPIVHRGRTVGLRGIAIDITERKQMEGELLRSQRLATIGEMASMVGHDLRNPLTGITSAAYYLRKKEGPKLSERSKEMLRMIEENVQRSEKIISDLLDYSKEIHMQTAQTDAKSITKNALRLVKIPKTVHLVDSTHDEPKIDVDIDKMTRALVNLIMNAVDAMPKGGTLRIKSRKSKGNLEISVADTGVGITRDLAENIWSPLFTTKATGIGLGLPITKRFVEAHAGSVNIKTRPGKGSTFTVVLPIKRREVRPDR